MSVSRIRKSRAGNTRNELAFSQNFSQKQFNFEQIKDEKKKKHIS